MVIHSRRKTERRPIVKVEKPVQEVATSGYFAPADEKPAEVAIYTRAASSDEQVNKKPRKKKKRVVEE